MWASRKSFGPVIAAGVLLVLCGVAATQARQAAMSYLSSINLTDPPLGTAAPVVSPHRGPRLSRRVVLVIVDGLRFRDSFNLSYLDELRRAGIDAGASSHYPTISRPNYVSILTGVPPERSGVRTNDFDREVRLDSLMDRVRAAGLSRACAADASDGLAYMFTRDFDDIQFATWPGGLVRAAHRAVAADHALIVLIPGAVDTAGHESGARKPEYRRAILTVDAQLATALRDIDLTRDTVIVTADHGHTDRGGHGGVEPDVVDVPLILAGAGIRPGADVEGAQLIDIAPTIAALLGLPPPGHALGRTLTEALALDDAAAARIAASDAVRIAVNSAHEAHASAAARSLRRERRNDRLMIVAGFVVFALLALGACRRLGLFPVDWRILLVSVPAFPLAYYALLAMFGQRFSLSAVRDYGEISHLLFRFGLVSVVIQVVASWTALHGRVELRDRLAAANALTASGLFLAWIPASLMWALYLPPFIDVPRSALMVLVPAVFVAVSCFALASLVVLGLEIVVFFARAVDPRMRLRRLERAADKERSRLEEQAPPPAAGPDTDS